MLPHFTIPRAALVAAMLFPASCDRRPQSPAVPANEAPRDPLEALLREKDAVDELPFSRVVETASGFRLLPIEPEQPTDREIVAAVDEAAREVLGRLNDENSPVRGLRRINEASAFAEDALRETLDALPGFSCDIPANTEGKQQRTGYPDLRLLHKASGRVTYVDPKLFEETSARSSLRTFYFTPNARTGKILEDAHHLLVGIAHDGNDGDWTFVAWHVVDLSRLTVRLKAEFQASNRDLYQPGVIISSGEN